MQTKTEISKPRFRDATEDGEIVNKDGYHQPGGNRFMPDCGCNLTTEKGAYRDVTVEIPPNLRVWFYHQSPVVVENEETGEYRLDSCGWKTSSTKQRINRYIPRGYKVIQRDYEWYVTTPDDDRIPFEDGMIVSEN